jgi:hypothetical protein
MVGDDREVEEEHVQIGVVAVAEEGLGVCPDELRVQVLEHLDLVRATDGAKDGLDCGVREGGVHVARPFFRGGIHLAGGGVLDRHKPEDLADAPQALLVDRGEHRRQPHRRR